MILPKFSSKCFMAPMAGVSDPAFRQMCLENGAGLVYTELTSIHGIIAKQKEGDAEFLKYISHSPKGKPCAIQLFGNDITAVKQAATAVSPYFDIVDLNMGCPAPHITAQVAGAALLQRADHVEKLFSALVSSSEKPVTVKLRLGVNGKNTLFLKIAKIADDAGISMITLHPRTVEQGYSGISDWTKIAELKSAVSCPVVGNGDIKKAEDAKRMFDETHCDYVMIGRAAMGNPRIFHDVNSYLKTGKYAPQNNDAKKKMFLDYANRAEQVSVKFSDIKNQAMYFSKGLSGGVDIRRNIAAAKDIARLREIFENQ